MKKLIFLLLLSVFGLSAHAAVSDEVAIQASTIFNSCSLEIGFKLNYDYMNSNRNASDENKDKAIVDISKATTCDELSLVLERIILERQGL